MIERNALRAYSTDIASGHSTGRELYTSAFKSGESASGYSSKRTASGVSDVQRDSRRNNTGGEEFDQSKVTLSAQAGQWQTVNDASSTQALDVVGPKPSSSAAAYLQEEEPEEESQVDSFKFKEKSARLDHDGDESSEVAPVAFKKRKTNKNIRKKDD